MTSPIWSLLKDLKGVLYGTNVLLDFQETIPVLRESLAILLLDPTTDVDRVADHLCKFFLPSTVLDVSETIMTPVLAIVLAIVEPLLPTLRNDLNIRRLQEIHRL